jgi:hypothetical protein
MAIEHFFAGPATVSVQTRTPSTGVLGTAFDLGINREAIPIIVTPSMLDVPSDDFGGPDGVPADVQYMGAIANIQLSLTKFDKAFVDSFLTGYTWDDGGADDVQTAGILPEFGAFARQNSFFFKMTLTSAYVVRTFEQCIVRNGGATGQGTRYASYDLQVECHIDTTTARELFGGTYT